MNVPNIGQGPGSVTTHPRAAAGGDTAAPGADAAVPVPAPSPDPSRAASFTRLAWFDVNGDGHIDPRSASAGGDATMLVPAHTVELPTYQRKVHEVGGPYAVREPASRDDERAASAPANAVQTGKAIDAYQRYGLAPTPPVAPAAPPASEPAVA